MFGISLPELIVILAVALIVVGPDKLPGLARSLAKGLMEMKKTLHQVKESLAQESETLQTIHHDLRSTTEELRTGLINADFEEWKPTSEPVAYEDKEPVIDLEPEARAIEAELRGHDDPAAGVSIAGQLEKQSLSPEASADSEKSTGDNVQAS